MEEGEKAQKSPDLGELVCYKKDFSELCIGHPIPSHSKTCGWDRWDSYYAAENLCKEKGAQLLTREEWIWIATEKAGAEYFISEVSATGPVYSNRNHDCFHMPDELGLDNRGEYWTEESNIIDLSKAGQIASPLHYARCELGLKAVCGFYKY